MYLYILLILIVIVGVFVLLKAPDYYKCYTVKGDDSNCKTSCCNKWTMQ